MKVVKEGIARVVNGVEIGYGIEEQLRKFCDCPYIVGIEIFVLGIDSRKQELEIKGNSSSK